MEQNNCWLPPLNPFDFENVYQEYENGTAFILNFNDYEVITVVDGVTYTVGAYGYVVLKN